MEHSPFGGHGYGDCSAGSWDFYCSLFSLPNPITAAQPDPEEDLYPGGDPSEFLHLFSGWPPTVMHPNLVSTLKNMVAPSPCPALPDQPHYRDSAEADGPITVVVGGPITVAAEGPLPPLTPPQATEKPATSTDEAEEADVVSVDLIRNRRPFRCGQEGCNKTFKNPQTMKMHHKTHYGDRGPGLAALPTLGSAPKAAGGHNKKNPSRCPKCKKTFVGLYELRRHYGRKHSEGEKPFACRKCAKKFYIEVDVRDHEKLCGEPIECKCGLKFAFKCNLVAHKKAHPACQDQGVNNNHHRHRDFIDHAAHSTNSSANNHSCTTEDSGQSRGSSPPLPTGAKRHREETAGYSPTRYRESTRHHAPALAPDFNGLPEVPVEYKAARYDFLGLQYSTEGSSVWASNVHYPSVGFSNFPVASLYSTDQGAPFNYAHKVPQVPLYDPFNGAGPTALVQNPMGITYNPLNSLQGAMVGLN